MPVGPNLSETPRCARIRKFGEIFIYILLLFFIYPISLDQEEYLFQRYLQSFNKSYENDTVYHQRFEAFKESLKRIQNLNSNRSNESAAYGLTKYSDMFPEEFSKSHLVLKQPFKKVMELKLKVPRPKRSINTMSFNLPQKVDMRKKRAVSDILAQGSCGACWAFAVIGIIETMNALKTGNLTKLSVQQMIDCSDYDYGCKGGDICTLLDWITTFDIKILTEDTYPLSLESQTCKSTVKHVSEGVKIEGFNCESFVGNEDVMLYILANFGPLAVGINAESWQHYIGGIIKFHCNSAATSLNHAVQIVGYDLTASIPHYIIRNSWGTDFGDDGYLYVAIGNNLCGLAHEVASVQVL